MAFARTGGLRSEVERAFPERPFAVAFWDGTTIAATAPEPPTFEFISPSALAHVLRAPGELGLARAYVTGLLEIDDLDGAVRVVAEWEPPPLTVTDRLRLARELVRATGLVAPPRAPTAELRLRGRRHSAARDAARSGTTTTSATSSSRSSSTNR